MVKIRINKMLIKIDGVTLGSFWYDGNGNIEKGDLPDDEEMEALLLAIYLGKKVTIVESGVYTTEDY